MRGIRGATTVGRNEKEEIWLAAQELITELLRTNAITPADIGAAIFSVTDDLTAAFPTAGVRRIQRRQRGAEWLGVPGHRGAGVLRNQQHPAGRPLQHDTLIDVGQEPPRAGAAGR